MNQPYFIHPFVDTGLGNSTYLIGSHETKKAILIDPLRDVDLYLATASQLGLSLTHVLDTHLHADFISGNREIAQQTKAIIGASATAEIEFDYKPLDETSILDFGAFQIHVLTTPGHSPEHISFLIIDEHNKPSALFSGGALIVGGAARTDLLGHEHTHSLAQNLYKTIHHKLLKLPDEVNVYPTHGAGSFCIAPASSERTTTIGIERKNNPFAQPQSQEEFIKLSQKGLPAYPTYYKYMRGLNQRGIKIWGGVPVLNPLTASEVKHFMDEGVIVIDIRHHKQFGLGHIPDSYGIAVNAPLIVWAGWAVPFGSRIILVGESPDQRLDATRQLIRIGYDNLIGYLDGGIESWAKEYPIENVQSINAKDLRERLSEFNLIDVRRQSEWDGGHIPNAIHYDAGRLTWEDLDLPHEKPLAIQCASGNRSMIAISILKRRGYKNLIQVEGGINQWKLNNFEIIK